MDVDFMISDTFEILRPQLVFFSSYEEANEAVDRMLLEQLKSVQGTDGKVQEDGFESESESESDEGEDDEPLELQDDEEVETGDEEANAGDGAEEDVVVLKNREEQISKEEEEDFEREFSRMMAESMESRKFEKKTTVLDVPIPMNLRGTQDRRTAAAQEKQQEGTVEEPRMAFTLLTKKGNRQQTRTMQVPADSVLAISTRSKQEAEREEQQQLKKLVLNYEEREEAAARQAAIEERARQRGGFRGGRRVFHMGGGAGHAYANQG